MIDLIVLLKLSGYFMIILLLVLLSVYDSWLAYFTQGCSAVIEYLIWLFQKLLFLGEAYYVFECSKAYIATVL